MPTITLALDEEDIQRRARAEARELRRAIVANLDDADLDPRHHPRPVLLVPVAPELDPVGLWFQSACSSCGQAGTDIVKSIGWVPGSFTPVP